ncbi:hypothetical protein [Novosphingobium lentum]|uniref:hypothetical protein n=1 Tax=Novosphingobium lentum TaxID=145287 RepID=UPI00082F488F|nr:hypothetical protein [Novosphingobium lentum]
MTIAIRPALTLAALILALPGCQSKDNDPGPGGVTVGEARALDDAAQMLDARQMPVQPDPHPDAPPATLAGHNAQPSPTAGSGAAAGAKTAAAPSATARATTHP